LSLFKDEQHVNVAYLFLNRLLYHTIMMKCDFKSPLVLTGIIGLLASFLVGAGEFLLNFDALARYSEINYDFMKGTSNRDLNTGHFIGVLSAPLYLVGCWHIYLMLKPASKTWAMAAFLISAYGFVVGAVWIGSRASIGTLANLPDTIQIQMLIELYQFRYETLLTVIRLTTLVLSLIFIGLVLTGKSHYPRWVAIFNPITLILASFIVFAAFPAIGKYPLPIALNVAFFIFFIISIKQAHKV
jgi:uncharacterized protein DUF6796